MGKTMISGEMRKYFSHVKIPKSISFSRTIDLIKDNRLESSWRFDQQSKDLSFFNHRKCLNDMSINLIIHFIVRWKTCCQLTSNGLSVRSIISTKCVLRNTSAWISRMEFDINEIRWICWMLLNEKVFNSTRFSLNSIRRSCKRWRWRNACGLMWAIPVWIMERYWRFCKP